MTYLAFTVENIAVGDLSEVSSMIDGLNLST